MGGRRKLWLWVGVGVVGLGAVVGVIVVVGGDGGGHSAASRSSSTSTKVLAPPLTPVEASVLSSGLSAGTDGALRKVLAVPVGQRLDPNAARQLRALAPISFDVATFRAVTSTAATVAGTVAHPPAGQPSRWMFSLVRTSGTWKLVDAEPLR